MPGLPGVAALRSAGVAGLRLAAGTATLAAGGWTLRALRDTPAALGGNPAAIRSVAQGSPHYRDGVFHNIEPSAALQMDAEENRLVIFEVISGNSASRPRGEVPLDTTPTAAQSGRLAATWLGHATTLLEVDGYRLLTDPVWSERCSPSRSVGPQRLHPPPLALEALPALDAVIISHDHYDHLDMPTVRALARSQRAPFLVPLGVGAHLREWGVPDSRIIELDWGSTARIGELTLVCTPARHFSGRFLSRNNTLWASWTILGPQHRAFFGGDSGYTRSYADIGAEHGPFDLTVLPIGAYNKSWPDIHMNPEEAVRAHLDLGGGRPVGMMLPIHWATFRLAPHPWGEPADRLVAAAADAGVEFAIPKPGGRAVPGAVARAAEDPWWRL